MPTAKRPRRDVTEDWEQLRMLVTAPAQEAYELLRPIVLFGRTPAERAAETGVPERTLRRKADRFDAAGMASLFETAGLTMDDRRALPAEIRQAIVDLKAEYAALNLREIGAICAARFHRPVSHHTVQSVLASGRAPSGAARRFPPYREIADPVERRLAVVRLYLEGWNIKSIAGYLATTRPRVYDGLRRWFAEGLPGLEDQSRAPKHPARKVDLKALAAIRRLQANPELGGFRVSAALEQREIDRGRPWQNYIEANFGTMRRMADYHLSQATTWPALHAVHARFFRDYNEQKHFAHAQRTDGRQSPAQVLGFVRGAWCDPADLDRLFRARAHRRVDGAGFVRFRNWRFYGERGLAGAAAAVWVLGEALTIEYATDTLARYQIAYEPDERRIRAVAEPQLFATRYPSPQPFLGTLAALEWHRALRVPLYQPRRKRRHGGGQVELFPLGDVAGEKEKM